MLQSEQKSRKVTSYKNLATVFVIIADGNEPKTA